MKLINYNYGNIDKFSCVIRGKIIVSPNEWRDIQLFLFRKATLARLALAKNSHVNGVMVGLAEDISRTIATRSGFLVNIRTSATKEVVKHFKPLNARSMKCQNYMFEITTKK